MRRVAIVDAGPLVAALDRREVHHAACVEVLRRPDLDLVIPALVVAEVAHFADARQGPAAEAAFIRGLAGLHVVAPGPDDWPVIAALVERCADLRLGATDASIAVLADRLTTNLVVTLDRRHFETLRSPDGQSLEILPQPRRANEEMAAYATSQG
jgi:predicted nucleic acid-binding protein